MTQTNSLGNQDGFLRDIFSASVLSVVASAIIGFLKSTYLFASSADHILQAVANLVIVIVTIVLIRRNHSRYQLVVILTVFAVLLIVGNLLIAWIALGQPTVYFVIDDSDNMGTDVQLVAQYVRNSIREYDDQAYAGLTVFGRNAITPPASSESCDSISQWIELRPKGEIASDLDRELSSLQNSVGQGRGNLQNAIIYAIDQLIGRRVIANIVVITSTYDNRCENFSRRKADEHAEQVGVTYELTILTVGSIPDFDAVRYDRCADRYEHVGDDYERIETAVSFFGQTRTFPYGRLYNQEPTIDIC